MTRLLLDTQAFLWMRLDDPRLTPKARAALLDSRSELFLSIVSVWEIVMKQSLGKLELKITLEEFFRTAFNELGLALLPLTLDHCLTLRSLPFHHRDPFDRMLIAQARTEAMDILGFDDAFDPYGIKRVS